MAMDTNMPRAKAARTKFKIELFSLSLMIKVPVLAKIKNTHPTTNEIVSAVILFIFIVFVISCTV